MAIYALTNAGLYLNEVSLSPWCRRLTAQLRVDDLDVTTFGASFRARIGGLADLTVSAEGFWDSPTPDVPSFAAVGSGGVVVTVLPFDGSDGAPAVLGRTLGVRYELGASIGEALPFSLELRADDVAANGRILAPEAARSTSGNGTAQQLGVGTGKRVVATAHVLAASGTSPSLTLKVQTDDSASFTSPTDLITFAPFSAPGAAHQIASGNADAFYRVAWTISGTSPSFTFVAAVGLR